MKNIDFQTILQSAPGSYLILMPDLTIAEASDNYLIATMTKREDVLGQGLFDIFPDNSEDSGAEGVSNLRISLNSVVEKKELHIMGVHKYNIRRPDGSFEARYWKASNKPILDSDKQLIYIIHSIEDSIYQIGADQKKIWASEEKLRSVNLNSPDFMNTIDRNGFITYTNKVAKGYKYEDIIGCHVLDFVPDALKKQYQTHLANAFSGLPQQFEMEGYGDNGRHAWYAVRMMLEEQNGEKLNSVLVISTDITAQRDASIRERVINNISKELNKDISITQFLSKIRLELGKVFDTENFYVSSFNKNSDKLTFIFQYIDNKPDPTIPHSRVNGNGLSEHLIRTKKSLLLTGDKIVTYQEKKGIYMHMDRTKSWLGVPLMFENDVLGVVAALSFSDGNAFTENDKELLTFVGSQVGAFMARREAEEKLKDSQNKWDSLVQNSEDTILIVSNDSIISYINRIPDFLANMGINAENVIGYKVESFVAFKYKAIVAQKLETSFKKRITTSFIMEGRHTGNYYSCTVTPLMLDDTVEGLIVIMKNITDLVLSQNKIKESEERYKNVVQDQTEYIVRWKPDGEIVFANKSYLDFNDCKMDELSKMNYFNLIPEKERKRFDQKIKSLTKKNPVQIDSHQSARSKTGMFWHEWIDRAIFDETGQITEYQSVGRDITKQRAAELEIRESEEFKESVLAALISGIAVIDNKGVIISLNEKWGKFAKLNSTILLKVGIGDNYLQMCSKAINNGELVASKVLDGIKKVLNRQSELFELEYQSNTLLGEEWLLMRVSPFKSEAGGAVIAHYDVTDKKQKECELQSYKNNLEKLVESRTTKLNELNLELEAFNYSVSHDLRTPIRAIDIYTGLLSQELKGTDVHSYVLQIEKCTAEMNELIKALMEFSKMSKTPITVGKIHLNPFIFHAFEKQKTFENVPNVVLKMNEMPIVLADERLLTIVFNNLTSNAIKYSSKNEFPIVEIGYAETSEKYVIYVKDNGVGFNNKLNEKLFKPFSRLHHGEEFKGTGAGLAIVDRIIKRHNGIIYAESEVDKGAVFYFTLPKKFNHTSNEEEASSY